MNTNNIDNSIIVAKSRNKKSSKIINLTKNDTNETSLN